MLIRPNLTIGAFATFPWIGSTDSTLGGIIATAPIVGRLSGSSFTSSTAEGVIALPIIG
jgi:hypothetical protein